MYGLLTGMARRTLLSVGPAALCRCGASANKPFCDGTHRVEGLPGCRCCRCCVRQRAGRRDGPAKLLQFVYNEGITINLTDDTPSGRIAHMPKRTGAQIIWECLVHEGVQTVFGYPGGAILPAYDAMLDYPVRHVLVRHEQGATHMADGFARASGSVGVAMATSGPGATNMVTGIATAMMDSSPMVCITGQVPSRMIGYGRVSGNGHLRHHAANHQAQLLGDGR